jgi:hypothetical protein
LIASGRPNLSCGFSLIFVIVLVIIVVLLGDAHKKHHVKLSSDERKELQGIARKQRVSVTKVQRAWALLAVDCAGGRPAMTDLEASAGSGLTVRSIERLRARVCEVGPLGALERKQRETPPVPAKITGEVEARMVQIACPEAPEGHDRCGR